MNTLDLAIVNARSAISERRDSIGLLDAAETLLHEFMSSYHISSAGEDTQVILLLQVLVQHARDG